jgi:hypothetical protein
MKSFSLLAVAGLALALAIPATGLAQTPTTDKPNSAVTGMKPDRTTATATTRKAMQEKEAVQRKKRAECRAKAKAEKVSLTKRPAYVKSCVAQAQ